MKKFSIGFFGGLIFMLFICIYFSHFKQSEYVVLNQDYNINENGLIRKGTKLKIDQGMPEGFTRYILYLNSKGLNCESYEVEHKYLIIPYWLSPID